MLYLVEQFLDRDRTEPRNQGEAQQGIGFVHAW
jgi:hypothetical protein